MTWKMCLAIFFCKVRGAHDVGLSYFQTFLQGLEFISRLQNKISYNSPIHNKNTLKTREAIAMAPYKSMYTKGSP